MSAGITFRSTVPVAADSWRGLLRRGASTAFVVSLLGAGLGFLAHVFVARLIGEADYGVFTLMLSWVSVLSVVAQAGQDNNVVRFLPTYVLNGEFGRARGLRRGIGRLVLASSVVIMIAGCVVVHFAGAHHDAPWRATFYVGFATLPVLTQLQQSGAMHRAFKRAGSSNAYVAVVRPMMLIAAVSLALVWLGRVNAPVAAVASGISTVVALGLSALHLSRAWPAAGRNAPADYEWRRWIHVGVQMSVLSLVVVAGAKLDILILGALLGATDVGPYYAAVQIAGFAFYGFQAVNVILAPMIAERYDAGDLLRLETIVRRGARMGCAAALAAAAIFALLGRQILGVFGVGFVSAYLPLLVLLVGYSMVTAIGPGGFVLSMTRYQKQASVFAGIGFLVNGALAVALVPRLGALGAAIGAAASLVVWHSLALVFVRMRVGINSAAFGRSLVTGGAA